MLSVQNPPNPLPDRYFIMCLERNNFIKWLMGSFLGVHDIVALRYAVSSPNGKTMYILGDRIMVKTVE